MIKEVEKLKAELEAWKERANTKQELINILTIRNQALKRTLDLLIQNN